jgi:hypothetical protein
LHLLSDDERRALCRRELEALEHWLRRLIHESLSAAHGPDYLEAVDQGRRCVFNGEVRKSIVRRQREEPQRYQRPVDAALLDDLVTVICNPFNWKQYFGAALSKAFPLGNDEARSFLKRLVPIRNKLSHANPISVHEAARVICYTLDVIQALKDYYMKQNLEKDYNVPTIIRVTDSLGNVCNVSSERGDKEGGFPCRFNRTPSGYLRPGDRLSIEVEVDPSFERSSYRIQWIWNSMKPEEDKDCRRIVIDFENRHVKQEFAVWCRVISSEEWHKLGGYDDEVGAIYRVLPPLSRT